MKLLNIKDENLYYIGGIVRDILLGVECFDIDITYVGNATDYAKKKGFKIIKENKAFNTVKVIIEGQEVDLASTRDEIYERAGHLPTITKTGCSLKQDILRRDFTINTLAKSLKTGEIIDYAGGVQDIKNKKLKVLHDKSFIDDPTRIIRGLKFSVRFGFELDEHTKQLQNNYLNNINYDMSYKRLKKELTETFNLNKQEVYERFFDEGMYKLLSQQSMQKKNYNIQKLIEKYPIKNTWLVYLGYMNISKLPLTKKEKKIINDFNKIKNLKLTDDYSIYSAFKDLEKESILLYAIHVDEQPVLRYFDKLSGIKIKTTGYDLQQMGILPSEKYSQCFEYLIKEKINNKNIDEKALIKKFFKI